MMTELWGDMLQLFSSEALDHTTSILSNLVTTGIAVGGYRLAQNWLEQRNKESAHAAANRFFDELIDLPSVLWSFIMDSGRCAAFMATLGNNEQFRQHQAEVLQRLLLLSEKSLVIKLRFFGHFARADRRGANIRETHHATIEHALLTLSDTSCIRLNAVASTVTRANNHGDYLQAVRDMNAFLIELNELSATVNAAICPVIGVSFSDYFSFADTSVLRGDRH